MLTQTTCLETADELIQADCCVIPVKMDGSKAPAVAWKQYTQSKPEPSQVRTWLGSGTYGVGVITGAISGGLEMLEIEGRASNQISNLKTLSHEHGLAPLWERIVTGWSEQSPSGGLHFFYRLEGVVPKNVRLAKNVAGECLAETRGEGGFVVLAPTGGRAHPTGKPWMRLSGSPASVPTLTQSEREQLHGLFRLLDETKQKPLTPVRKAVEGAVAKTVWEPVFAKQEGDITPGDDFEQKNSWEQILTPHGWSCLGQEGGTTYWTRPGKKSGVSATTGRETDRDRLYVFSSSTVFEQETPYTKFAAYALLHHDGDYSAAAKRLASQGYGTHQKRHLHAVDAATGEALEQVFEPLSDTYNANLLCAQHQQHLQYVADAGKWASWDGKKWDVTPDSAPAYQAAVQTIKAIPETSDALAKWKTKSLGYGALTNMVKLAGTMPRMITSVDRFDANRWQLNTQSGVIDLKTGHLLGHDPAFAHAKITETIYDIDAKTPLWDTFLSTVFDGNESLVEYVQKIAGISLIGEVIEHILPFLYGEGGNGKSVFLETLSTILGDYATEAPHGFLVAGRERHETELANLLGKRLVIASEINQDTRFDEAKMKALTGGDRISARFMRRDFFHFTPSHTLWLMGNHQPKVEAGGRGFWRRLRLIPFTKVIPESQQISDLQKRLVEEEGGGILAWMVVGLLKHQKEGLPLPEAVAQATETYKDEEDHLGRFIAERCVLGGGPGNLVSVRDMRMAYSSWCELEGETALTNRRLGRELKKFGIVLYQANSGSYYQNVDLSAVHSGVNWSM